MLIVEWFLGTKIGRGLLFVGGILAAVAGIFLKGKYEGRHKALENVQQKDEKNAAKVQAKAESAKASVSATPDNVDSQLSEFGAIRQDK